MRPETPFSKSMRDVPAKPATKKNYTSNQPFAFLKISFLLLLLFFIKLGQIFRLPWGFGLLLRHRKRGRPRKKSLKWTIVLGVIVFLFLIYSLVFAKLLALLPSPYQLTSAQRPLTTEIYDRNGRLLYQIYEGRNRKLTQLENLPPYLIQATVAIEDKHFFTHPGVDPAGIIRALKFNLASQSSTHRSNDLPDVLQGGSTITQQLIKNTLLTPDQTLSRKIKEALLAFWVERIYNKEDILTMYFNEAPYGGPAWGIEAASEMYFGKETKNLSLSEASFLAGLPAAPTEYSPYGAHPEKGLERQKEVLRRMVEDSYITKEQAEQTSLQPLTFQPPTSNIQAPHFVMYVRSLLAAEYGERVVSQGGLKVTTTLDLSIQEMAENVVAEEVGKLGKLKVGNGAAMVTDPRNGQILAMVGSKDYFDPQGGNFNVTLALRQPGSSIKVVTYATAFKQGLTPGAILLDTPATFPNPWGPSYSPKNYDGTFHGAVTLRTALGSSYNVPAVKVLNMVGLPAMLQTARDMGITTLNQPENYGLSLTLGGGAVRMLDMMTAYGTLAAEGVKFTPQAILKVTDAYGNVLEDHQQASGKRVLTEEVAYLLDHILADNGARTPAFGPNSLLVVPGHTVAAKTGTSDDKRDNWTFGFSPEIMVGAWVGNNDNSPMDPQLSSGITGATPIWNKIMSNLLLGKPDLVFKRPKGIIETTVRGHKDLAIVGQAPKEAVGYKKVKQKDEATDPFSAFTPKEAQAIR